MAGRKLMIGHVKFTLKASVAQREAMRAAAESVGIGWHEMLKVAEGVCVAAAQRVTDAAIVDMADHWSGDEWLAAKERFA